MKCSFDKDPGKIIINSPRNDRGHPVSNNYLVPASELEQLSANFQPNKNFPIRRKKTTHPSWVGDPLDRVLAIGATFDWITPAYGMIRRRLLNEATVKLDTTGYAGLEHFIFRQAGIRQPIAQTRSFSGDSITFNAKPEDVDKIAKVAEEFKWGMQTDHSPVSIPTQHRATFQD